MPQIDWYHNGDQLIHGDSVFISSELPFVVKHHRHLNVTARLIIKNVTRDTLGSYSCVINSKINVKNVTLKLSRNKDGNDESNKSNSDTLGKIAKNVKKLM